MLINFPLWNKLCTSFGLYVNLFQAFKLLKLGNYKAKKLFAKLYLINRVKGIFQILTL